MPNARQVAEAEELWRACRDGDWPDDKKTSPAKTNAQRQAEFRQRKATEQAAEVRGIFAHPDDHADIKSHAGKLARRRARLVAKRAP